MRRRSVLLVSFVLAGCGGGEPISEPPAATPDAAADRREVQTRTASYLRAYVRGDGPGACAQFSPALRRSIDARTQSAGTSCPKILRDVGPALLETLPAAERRGFEAQITDPAKVRVELAGDRARAGFGPTGEGRVPARVALERVEGRWLISQLGTQAPPTP